MTATLTGESLLRAIRNELERLGEYDREIHEGKAQIFVRGEPVNFRVADVAIVCEWHKKKEPTYHYKPGDWMDSEEQKAA